MSRFGSKGVILSLSTACAAFFVGPSYALGQAADPPAAAEAVEVSDLRPGEKVEVDWGGKTVSAEVVERSRLGWYKVKFDWNESELSPTLPPAKVRRLGKGADAVIHEAAAKPQPARKWKDVTGKFELEASFVGKDGQSVQLQRADGKVLKIPLAKLSPEDQAYVDSLVTPPGTEPVNPFEAAEVVTPARPAKAPIVRGEFDREADYEGMQELGAQWVPAKAFAPDALVRLEPPAAGKAVVLAAPGQAAKPHEFFENPKSIFLSAGGGSAVVVSINAPPGGERRVRIGHCDLTTQSFTGEVNEPLAGTPVDLSPSGTLLACLPEHFVPQGQKPMIEIVRLGEKGLTTVRRWNMGEHSEWARRFEQLWFIGEDKLLAASAWGGNIILWDIDQAKALWQLKVAGHQTPVLSANRKQFAAWIDGGVGVFDASTGETLARFEAQADHGSLLAFSPDGQKIASVAGRTARVWDIATGKQLHEVWFPKPMAAKALDWAGSYLLVDRSYLVDLDKRIVLWQYELPNLKHEPVTAMAGGVCWFLAGGGNSPYRLTGVTLPDAAAQAKGDSLAADSVLAIKPGAAVQIKINVPGATPEEVQQVTRGLVEEARSSGLKLLADAPIVIECSIVDGGQETVNYRRFGFGPIGPFGPFGPFDRDSGDEATVNKKLSVVSIKENGKELWIASGNYGAPFQVRQKDGQTIQEAVNEQKGNPVQFFLHVKLPRYVARHEADGTYGKSKLLP